VSSLCSKYHAKYRDYDNLIPPEEWGNTQIVTEEPDYMHFTGAGHKRLASLVKNDIAEFLLNNVTASK
jgi:lysophospholipase L1-like esterase